MSVKELLMVTILIVPFMAFIPYFTPPEWWNSLHDGSHFAEVANHILWLEMRLGQWEPQ